MLSEKIKTLRTEKGLSQEELALELNVVRQTVSKWEQGLSLPDAEQLVRLAEVLNTTVSEIVGEKLEEKPQETEKTAPKRSGKVWTVVLLCVGSPIWISLGAAAVAVAISLYVSMWSVIISLWAVFAALILCAVASVFHGGLFLTQSLSLSFVLLATALVSAGLSIFAFFGCKWATVGLIKLTKLVAVWIKGLFVKKGGAKNDKD